MFEAWSTASSARLLVKNKASSQQKETTEPAASGRRQGFHFSLDLLDAAVSHSMDAHVRRMIEIDTGEANNTSSWIIKPHPLGTSSVEPDTSTNFEPDGGERERLSSRVLHVLSRKEIYETMQCSDAASSAESVIGIIMRHVQDEAEGKFLVIEGVCNMASHRLRYAQLRLDVFRLSMLREGGAKIDVMGKKRRRRSLQKSSAKFLK